MPSRNWQPALIGGLFIGVLSALPIINIANCCCIWVIGGGVIAAYLMQNASAIAITIGDGALVGLTAGVIGAVIHAILSIPIYLVMGPIQNRIMQQWFENARDMPDSLRELMHTGMVGGAGLALAFVTSFMFWLVLGAIFATIGGMIGAAIFGRGKPSVVGGPPTYPQAPPPPPPPYQPPPPPPPAPPTPPQA